MRFAPILLVILLACTGSIASGQAADSAGSPGRSTVTGTVYDSLTRAPLAAAVVQLARVDRLAGPVRTAVTDSSGRYAFSAVTAGQYQVGFVHPMLETLGLEPPVRQIDVLESAVARAELWIPSAARIRAALCPESAASAGVVVGSVRDARDAMPIGGAVVTGSWLEFTIRDSGVYRDVPRVVIPSAENGWFAMCGVPREGMIAIAARSGADSVDGIEVQVPPNGLLLQEIYLGAAWSAAGDTAAETRAALRPRQTGSSRLQGTVSSAVGSRPIPGAQVRLIDGPATTADEQGRWTLVDAPAGTRMLEVRALGYYPQQQPVHVIPHAPPVQTTLVTLKSVLDTVRVVAARFRLEGTGFTERSRQGMGRFLDAAALARHQVIFTTDFLRMVPGVQVERTRLGDTYFTMRGAFGRCAPHIYIDGMHMRGLTGDDVNAFASPEDIAGIEVYAGAFAPPQFQQGMSGCGSIVIWTKPPTELAARWTWRRAGRALGVVLAGVGLGMLIT